MLVRGALAWQREGLNPPAVVRNATDEYRRESEPLAPFFDACCVSDGDASTSYGALFDAYTRWCNRTGVRDRQRLTNRTFGPQVPKRFERDLTNTRNVVYLGVCLVATEPEDREIPF